MSKVWLVTGSASGLGRNIAEAVLASGDRLVSTARDPRRLEDLVEKYGDPVKVAQVVLRLAASDRLPAHLLLGSDAVQFAGQAEATGAADAERWRGVSLSRDCLKGRRGPLTGGATAVSAVLNVRDSHC
jgi:NAD(P)-dependent dehydrogenase (short-subunit alcohol dehydrogenase family)